MKKNLPLQKIASGILFAALLAFLSDGAARAQIFVSNNGNGTVGEYTTSGGTLNADLFNLPGYPDSATSYPLGIALSGSDLFVGNYGGTLGEYTTSGSTTNSDLITVSSGATYDVAVSGSHLFVTNGDGVGEYNLDGTPVNANLITGVSGVQGVVVSGSDLFLDTSGGTIGEYTLGATPGTLASSNASLVSGGGNFVGIGVAGLDLYVVNANTSAVDVYSSTTGDPVTLPDGSIPGTRDLTIVGSDVFVTNGNTIGEYNLDGSAINANLITGLDDAPWGIAVEVPEPSAWAMMLGGLGCLVGLQRFRRKV